MCRRRRRSLLEDEPALLLELGLVDLALGETLLQDPEGACRGLGHLRLFATTGSAVATAHQHGQVLHPVTEIIVPSRPFLNHCCDFRTPPEVDTPLNEGPPSSHVRS